MGRKKRKPKHSHHNQKDTTRNQNHKKTKLKYAKVSSQEVDQVALEVFGGLYITYNGD